MAQAEKPFMCEIFRSNLHLLMPFLRSILITNRVVFKVIHDIKTIAWHNEKCLFVFGNLDFGGSNHWHTCVRRSEGLLICQNKVCFNDSVLKEKLESCRYSSLKKSKCLMHLKKLNGLKNCESSSDFPITSSDCWNRNFQDGWQLFQTVLSFLSIQSTRPLFSWAQVSLMDFRVMLTV